MKTVSFKLSEQLDNALTALARRRKSVTACVDEVTAGIDGPADLSTNRKHMAGYGK